MSTYRTISFIIPACNEAKTIAGVLDQLLSIDFNGLEKQLIIINDGSKDDTGEIADRYATKHKDIILINNSRNVGKSQSVRKGITSSTGDLVVIQDADLEIDPTDLLTFIDLFQKDHTVDVIFGNRFHKDNRVFDTVRLGNHFVTFVSNIFTVPRGFYVKDMEVCYKMARGELFREIGKTIESRSKFGMEPEVTAKFARAHAKVINLDISYKPRSHTEGKHMKPIIDGLKAAGEIVRFNLTSR